jgi:chromosome segregation ATPase
MNYKGYVHDHSMSIQPSDRIASLETEIEEIRKLYFILERKHTTLENENKILVAKSNTQRTQLTQSRAEVARLTLEVATCDALKIEVARLKQEVARLNTPWYHKFTGTTNPKSVEMLLADLNEL